MGLSKILKYYTLCNYFVCLGVNCSEGMIFQQCGPACPRTCDNKDKVCEGRCVEGCFCPDGKYLLDGKCVETEICTGD